MPWKCTVAPAWSSALTNSERLKAAEKVGELTATQIIAIQSWERQVNDLRKASGFLAKLKSLKNDKERRHDVTVNDTKRS